MKCDTFLLELYIVNKVKLFADCLSQMLQRNYDNVIKDVFSNNDFNRITLCRTNRIPPTLASIVEPALCLGTTTRSILKLRILRRLWLV